MKTLFVITGPTAVGKTAISLRVAKHLGVPVINADSRQIYQEIPIGTAAPTAEEQSEVKHYFVGTLHLTDYYSASMYEQDVLRLFDEKGELGSHPYGLLSGGSMMYIDAVCDGIDDIPTVDAETRSLLRHRLETEGLERLVEELRLLDPQYFQIVDHTSFRSNQRKERDFQIVKIGLVRPREELYDRINLRVVRMMEAGMEAEARRVYPYKGENSLNTVGYRELFDYFEDRCTLPEAIERIQGTTRRYCRKQLTWLKRDSSIRWFHPDDQDEILSYIDHCR